MIRVTLSRYLDRLRAEEEAKPRAEQRVVPTIPEIAEAVGTTRQGLHRMESDESKLANLITLTSVYHQLRAWGYDVQVGDLIGFVTEDELGESKPVSPALAGVPVP